MAVKFRNKTKTNTVVRFVPQQEAWVIERMGKYHRIAEPGPTLMLPFLDSISYVQSLKEEALEIPTQTAITADNVTLEIDGILYIRVIDPYKASYGVTAVGYAISQLAQTTMRSEIGQLTLDNVLKERQVLNQHITTAVNEAALDWGITCLRYEIRNVVPPANVLDAMNQQVSAERSKRARILESEGRRQAAVNHAEGEKSSTILTAEATSSRWTKEAEGKKTSVLLSAEADAARVRALALANRDQVIAEADGRKVQIIREAEATAERIHALAAAIGASPAGREAANVVVAERYIAAFERLAEKSNTLVVPATMSDMGGLVSSSLAMLDAVRAPGGVLAGHAAAAGPPLPIVQQ